jgi:outer membrane protein TolC
VTRDRFANGLSTSIEVDNAETSLSAAQNARIDALADEAQADVDLRKATGKIRDLVPAGKP